MSVRSYAMVAATPVEVKHPVIDHDITHVDDKIHCTQRFFDEASDDIHEMFENINLNGLCGGYTKAQLEMLVTTINFLLEYSSCVACDEFEKTLAEFKDRYSYVLNHLDYQENMLNMDYASFHTLTNHSRLECVDDFFTLYDELTYNDAGIYALQCTVNAGNCVANLDTC
jgi:hypothetical protein